MAQKCPIFIFCNIFGFFLSPVSIPVLTAIFHRGLWLPGIRISPFWIFLQLRMMEVVVTTGAIGRAKLQSNRHHEQTNTQHFTGRMPFLSPNKQCQSTERKWPILSDLVRCHAASGQLFREAG